MISSVVPGGLEAFQKMKEPEKEQWRKHAIKVIEKNCAENG